MSALTSLRALASPPAAIPQAPPIPEESRIPLHFFTAEEEMTIQSFFNYHLANFLGLLDLWGFDFYQNLSLCIKDTASMDQNLQEANSALDLFIQDFCTNFFMIYARIFRSSLQNKPDTPPEILQGYFLSDEQFVQRLEILYTVVNDSIRDTFQTARGLIHLSPAPVQKEKVLLTYYKSALTHLRKLRDLKDLWKKISESSYANFFFIDSSVLDFPGSEKLNEAFVLNPSTPLNETPAIKDILNFMTFLVRSFKSGGAKLGFNNPVFEQQLDHLKSHLDQRVTRELIHEWNIDYHHNIISLKNFREIADQDLALALRGELTHETWLEKNRIPLQRRKDLPEFCETLFTRKACTILMELFIDDVHRIIEHHLIMTYFPTAYRCKYLTVRAVLENIHFLRHEARKTRNNRLPNALQICLQDFNEQIENACQPFYNLLDDPELGSFADGWHSPSKTLPYSLFLNLITALYTGSPTLKHLEEKLPPIRQAFEQKIGAFLNTVPSTTFQTEKTKWQKELQESSLAQSIKLFRLISLFNDVNTIMEKYTFLEDFDFTLLPAFRTIFALPARMKKIFKHVVSPPEEPQIPTAPAVKPSVPLPVLLKEKESDLFAESLKKLKSALKRRELEKILQDLNFFFLRHGKGSHEIWSNGKGAQVVLPLHGNTPIKPGTRQAIIGQIRQAAEN